MKELGLQFYGKGEVKGYLFRQIRFEGDVYIYELMNIESKRVHYEVFERRINKQFECVSYPSSKAFGLWAYCCRSLEKAEKRFNELSARIKNRNKKLKLWNQQMT